MRRLAWLIGWTLIWLVAMIVLLGATLTVSWMFVDCPLAAIGALLVLLAFMAGISLVSLSDE